MRTLWSALMNRWLTPTTAAAVMGEHRLCPHLRRDIGLEGELEGHNDATPQPEWCDENIRARNFPPPESFSVLHGYGPQIR